MLKRLTQYFATNLGFTGGFWPEIFPYRPSTQASLTALFFLLGEEDIAFLRF